jgi:LacI family transcriptional regulator
MSDFSHNIAIIIPDMMNQFFSELAQQVQRCFLTANVGSVILSSDGRKDIELRHLRLAHQLKVDGIVFVSVGDHLTAYEMLSTMGIPYVVLDREVPESAACDFVISDNVHGTKLIVDFLIERGHRIVAYVAGDLATEPGRVRRETFLSYGFERGLAFPESSLLTGDFSFRSGYDAGKIFMANRTMASVVVCGNDFMAIGFLQVLKEANVRVPQNVGIIGYDDIPLSSWIYPRLTTVRQEISHMAQYAAEVLVTRIRQGRIPPTEDILKGPRLKSVLPRLIVRESCNYYAQ